MRIGVCGGTFDPFHRGHLDPVLHARETMRWDRVLYVPTFVQPFKRDRDTVSPYHRFAMAAAATLHDPGLLVSSIELERGAVSYTVDTLEQLRERHPGDTIDWVIGDDNLAALLEWKSIARIFELANFAVLARDGAAVPEPLRDRVREPAARVASGSIVFVENPTVPVSSTEIRRRVRAGEPIDTLVPPAVSRYIDHYGLYRKGQSD
jgi:nicotinate-nucleotide adenylyltransferase